MTAPLDNELLAEILVGAWTHGICCTPSIKDDFQRHVDVLIAEGLVAYGWKDMLIGARDEEEAARKRYKQLSGARSCSRCHCTDDWACEGGCWWVAPDLCSNCAPEGAEGTA